MEQEKITLELNRNLVIGFSIGLIVGYLISNWRRASNPPYYNPSFQNFPTTPVTNPSFSALPIDESRTHRRAANLRKKMDMFSSDNPYTEYEI